MAKSSAESAMFSMLSPNDPLQSGKWNARRAFESMSRIENHTFILDADIYVIKSLLQMEDVRADFALAAAQRLASRKTLGHMGPEMGSAALELHLRTLAAALSAVRSKVHSVTRDNCHKSLATTVKALQEFCERESKVNHNPNIKFLIRRCVKDTLALHNDGTTKDVLLAATIPLSQAVLRLYGKDLVGAIQSLKEDQLAWNEIWDGFLSFTRSLGTASRETTRQITPNQLSSAFQKLNFNSLKGAPEIQRLANKLLDTITNKKAILIFDLLDTCQLEIRQSSKESTLQLYCDVATTVLQMKRLDSDVQFKAVELLEAIRNIPAGYAHAENHLNSLRQRYEVTGKTSSWEKIVDSVQLKRSQDAKLRQEIQASYIDEKTEFLSLPLTSGQIESIEEESLSVLSAHIYQEQETPAEKFTRLLEPALASLLLCPISGRPMTDAVYLSCHCVVSEAAFNASQKATVDKVKSLASMRQSKSFPSTREVAESSTLIRHCCFAENRTILGVAKMVRKIAAAQLSALLTLQDLAQLGDITALEKGLQAVNVAKVSGELIFLASGCGQLKVIATLVSEYDGDPNSYRDKQGRTAAHMACEFGDLRVLELLNRSRANLDLADNDGIRPLHTACATGQIDLVNYLLDCGADAGAPAADGSPPMRLARANGQIEAMHVLIDRGADPDHYTVGLITSDYSWTPDTVIPKGTHTLVLIGEEYDVSGSIESMDFPVGLVHLDIGGIQCPALFRIKLPSSLEELSIYDLMLDDATCDALCRMKLPPGLQSFSLKGSQFRAQAANTIPLPKFGTFDQLQLPQGLSNLSLDSLQLGSSVSRLNLPRNLKKLQLKRNYLEFSSARDFRLPDGLEELDIRVNCIGTSLTLLNLPKSLKNLKLDPEDLSHVVLPTDLTEVFVTDDLTKPPTAQLRIEIATSLGRHETLKAILAERFPAVKCTFAFRERTKPRAPPPPPPRRNPATPYVPPPSPPPPPGMFPKLPPRTAA